MDIFSVIWKFFVWTISISGCIYQIYRVSDAYFDRETVNRVIVNRSNYIIPPKVVTCYHSEERRMKSVLTHTSNQLFNESLGAGLVLRHAIYETIKEEYEFARDEEIVIDKFFKDTKYVCYAISLTKDIHRAVSATTLRGLDQLENFDIQYYMQFDFMSKGQWYLFLIPLELDFYGSNDNGLILPNIGVNDKPYRLSVSYSYFRSELLPFPYKTNCRDYSDIGKQSQAHAIQSCFDDCIYGIYKRLPSTSLISEKIDEYVIDFPSYTKSSNLSIDARSCRLTCQTKNQKPDCVTETYLPNSLNLKAMKGVRYIGLATCTKPQISTKSIAAIDIVDYVTYILSSFSFWFAFSPLMVLTDERVYEFLKARFQARTN